MFSQNTNEIQSKLKFSVKAKAKYNRNINSEGYPTLFYRTYQTKARKSGSFKKSKTE